MTLQQIMYFQQVARSGSFTKAARACFVSQTAISRQISALEEELHVTLLERDTAHVKLTLAGEYFFQQVNELTARLEEVVTRTQTIAQEQQTHLTLGIPTILEQHAISQLLRQYHNLHPEVQLSTVAGSRQQLVSQLVDRKIDLLVAMDFDLPDLEGLDSIILQQVHATWLLPTGHPLAGAEKIAPQQLQGDKCRINNLYIAALDFFLDISYFLRTLIDQKNDEMHIRAVFEDRFGHILEKCGLTSLRWRYDHASLTFTDRA